jgi:hypothetical protein
MVKTRVLTVAVSLAVLLSSVGAPAVAQDEPLDFSDAPFVIFAPAPPKPAEIAHYPIPDGAEDFWELFEDEAPWADALEHIDAFAMHAWMFRYSTTDDQLRSLFAFLDEHELPFGLEVEPLTWPGPEVCDHGESFEGPYDLEQIARIHSLGGRIDFLSFDEPYSHAYRWDQGRPCNYTLEQTVDEAFAFVEDVRAIFPDVQVGSIEPMWTDPFIDAADMALWLDAWEEGTGEPFAFLNMDIDWRREDWPEVVAEVQAVADERGVPLGMLYLGSEFSEDNDEWLRQLATHAATLEVDHGVAPDVVGFYSWHDVPDRLLPDDDLDTYTGRINQYFGTRTRIGAPEVEGKVATGTLATIDGAPLPGLELTVSAVPLDGSRSRHRLSGTVPAGAREALIGVRANIEGGSPGRVDVRISDVSYREDGGSNKVPNPRFRKGLEGWGSSSTGRVTAVRSKDGRAMRVKARRKQSINIDGQRFGVTPGAEFDFAATLDVPGSSIGTGYVSVIFLADSELRRDVLEFDARPADLAPVTTDADGVFRIPLGELRPGRYDLSLTYDGNLEHWAARTQERIRVR